MPSSSISFHTSFWMKSATRKGYACVEERGKKLEVLNTINMVSYTEEGI